MTRLTIGVLFSCVLLAGCAGDIPTTPSSELPDGVPTALSLSVDRKTLPAEGLAAEVNVTIAVTVQEGTRPDRVPVQIVLAISGADEPLSDLLYTDTAGRIERAYNLSASATIAISAGGLSDSVRVTRAEPAEIPDPPVTEPDDDDDDDLPTPEPRLLVSLSADTTTPDTVTPVTFTALVTPINGAAPATSYAWDFDGDSTTDQTTTSASTTHTYTTADSVTARVTVTNGSQTTTATRGITVSAVGLSVDVEANPSTAEINEHITFTASVDSTTGVSVPSGLLYSWDIDDDGVFDTAPAQSNELVHPFTAEGTTTVRVQVTGDGITAVGSVDVTITAPELFVLLTVDDGTPALSQAVVFTATVSSTGPVPTDLEYAWSIDGSGDTNYEVGDGTNTQAASFDVAGTHMVRVRVTDPVSGRTATTTRTITVS